VFLMTRFG